MTAPTRRAGALAARLRPHVARSRHGGADRWPAWRNARPLSGAAGAWATMRWRLASAWGCRRRSAELAVIAEQLALLSEAGYDLAAAAEWIVARGGGITAGDLAVVTGWLRAGQPPAEALRRWAAARGCVVVGRLAAAVELTPPGDRRAALLALSASLHRRVHDRRMAALGVRARIVWCAAATGIAVCLIHAVR